MIKTNIIKSRLFWQTFSADPQHQNLISLLQSCSQSSQAAQVHALMSKTGLDNNPFPLSKLLARVSLLDIHYASSIFNQIRNPNPYMFNAMLRGYSLSDYPQKGLRLFNLVRSENQELSLDQFSFVCVLKCCARLSAIWTGVGVHAVIVRSGFGVYVNVENSLLRFYSVCGRIGEAHQVFDGLGVRRDLVSWNTLMGGYLGVSRYDLVVDLFKELCGDGSGVSVTTVLSVLSALGELRNAVVPLGECVHAFCVKVGFLLKLNVVTALISMYGKHGRMDSAGRIFDEVDFKRDVVLWNCLIDGYAKAGLLEEAVELMRSMEHDNVHANSSTLAGLLSACSGSRALAIGQYVHDYVEEQQMVLDVVLGTALVDMYAKSGLLGKAIDIFNKMESKDVRSWTAMISGYGAHGKADRAIALFYRMEEEGFAPNEVTFLAILNSCSHGGLVAEGMSCFRRMVEVYKLKPKIAHYGCMIDLLGRAGLLEEAYELIKGLPVEGDATAWRALLGACKVYGNVDLAECVKRELEQINDEHPADLLALTSTYAVAGVVPNSSCVLEKGKHLVKEVEFGKKEAGRSSVELISKDTWEILRQEAA